MAPWSAAWNLYAVTLGAADGRRAVAQLSNWVTAICRWRNAPVRCFPQGCPYICRDECVASSMIAACQNNDDVCLRYCVLRFCGVADRTEALEAAVAFAGVLDTIGQRLVPVPAEVVKSLIEEPPTRSYH